MIRKHVNVCGLDVCVVNTEDCQYGDRATWCSNYVRGPAECQRSDVAHLCCHSCARYAATQPTTTSEHAIISRSVTTYRLHACDSDVISSFVSKQVY